LAWAKFTAEIFTSLNCKKRAECGFYCFPISHLNKTPEKFAMIYDWHSLFAVGLRKWVAEGDVFNSLVGIKKCAVHV
jgi:hypothetical protein